MNRKLVELVAVCSAWIAGCGQQGPEFSATYIDQDLGRRNMEQQRSGMVDSAMLQDMALADIHFMPHQTALNELGEKRLVRYVELLEAHGGTIRIEGSGSEEAFARGRADSVTAFLTQQGVDRQRIAVASGIRAGAGMAAVEGITVKQRAYAPEHALTDLNAGGSGGTMGTN